MSKKDEITEVMTKVLFDFMSVSNTVWDQVYLRFYSAEKGHSSIQFMFRKERELSPLRGNDNYDDLLISLMNGLFDEIEDETKQRPLVAVLTVDAEKNYNLKLDYQNPRALEIGYMGFGKATSYFLNNEVDIPDFAKEYIDALAAKGITETPILYEKRAEL